MTAASQPSQLAGRVAALLVALGLAAMFVSSVAYRLENPSRKVAARQPAASAMQNGGPENQEMMAELGQLMAELREKPKDVGVMLDIATRFAHMEAFDRVELFARRILALDPKHPEALNLLGIAAFRQHQIEEAESAFRKLTEVMPDNAPAQYNLGLIYRYHLNKPDEAQRRFQLAAKSMGDNAQLRPLVEKELTGGK